MKYRIGIDMGGTKIESVLLTPGGDVVLRERVPTPASEGYATILDTVTHLIARTAAAAPAGETPTVGMGIPGITDSTTGLVINANTQCLIGHPLAADLERSLGRPVRLENDANCFTLAETLEGAARGYDMVFGVIMGTGCGGGLCIQGDVRSGRHGICGEWGHVSIDPEGAPCFCGKRGCVETKISGSGMERSFRERFDEPRTMKEILEMYRAGEGRAALAMERFFDDFGRALGGILSILDPDAVVLGGGLSNIDELYTIGIPRVRKNAFHPGIDTPILKNALGDSAGVFGAAWLGV